MKASGIIAGMMAGMAVSVAAMLTAYPDVGSRIARDCKKMMKCSGKKFMKG